MCALNPGHSVLLIHLFCLVKFYYIVHVQPVQVNFDILALVKVLPGTYITKGNMQLPGVAPEVSFPMFENRQNFTSEPSAGFVYPD